MSTFGWNHPPVAFTSEPSEETFRHWPSGEVRASRQPLPWGWHVRFSQGEERHDKGVRGSPPPAVPLSRVGNTIQVTSPEELWKIGTGVDQFPLVVRGRTRRRQDGRKQTPVVDPSEYSMYPSVALDDRHTLLYPSDELDPGAIPRGVIRTGRFRPCGTDPRKGRSPISPRVYTALRGPV